MAASSSPARIVIPEPGTKTPTERLFPSVGKDTVKKLDEATQLCVSGAPATRVMERVLLSISELYGLTDMVLDVQASDLRQVLRFALCGYPESKANQIMQLLSSELFPKGLVQRTLDEKYRVSRSGYLIPGEEWRRLTANEPFSDHPAFYKFPEKADTPREGKDQFLSLIHI